MLGDGAYRYIIIYNRQLIPYVAVYQMNYYIFSCFKLMTLKRYTQHDQKDKLKNAIYSLLKVSSKERTFRLLKEIMINSMCIAVVSIPNVKVLTKSTL